jgi:serine/threonine protein kinase
MNTHADDQQPTDIDDGTKELSQPTGELIAYSPASAANAARSSLGAETREYQPRLPTETVDPEEGRRLDELRQAVRLPNVPGYKLLGVLGHGGMGVVYRARQDGLNRLVALKMILAGEHAGPQHLARFQAEAQAVARLQHPNIVQVYEVGKHNDLPYFSLEFVDGGSLAQLLDHKPQPPRAAAEMIETLARAIHYAHEHGIVHRDLKPGNVLLATGGVLSTDPAKSTPPSPLNSHQPKITDFGLAKRLDGDSSQTRTGTIMGSPSYMAPEQARGEAKDVGPLADVHALGAVLYEMLTGRPPYLAATAMDTVMAVLKDEPVPPSRLQPRIPRDLETICLKCLQKEPAKRYASAAALADDVRRFLSGEPIQARPISSPERLWRWCQRNPRLAVLSALLLLLLLGVAVGSTLFSFRLAAEKKSALEARDLARSQTDLAVESLATLVREVQQKLADRPDVAVVRQEIIKLAMDRLQQVEKAWVSDEGKTERSMAAAYMLMGELHWELNERKEAARYYQQCHELVLQLHKEQPESDKANKNLAVAVMRLGDVKSLVDGDVEAARGLYLDGLGRLDELAAKTQLTDNLKPYEVNVSLAHMLDRLSQLEKRVGRLKESRTYAERALTIWREESKNQPKNQEARLGTAGMLTRLADICFSVGDNAHCLRLDKDALDIHEALYKENAEGLSYRRGLLLSLAGIGDHYLRQTDPVTAMNYYPRHLNLAQKLADLDSNPTYKRDLALAHYRMATAELMLNRPQAADEHYRKSLQLRIDLFKMQQSPSNIIGLMIAQARCGEHAKAVKNAEALRQLRPANPSDLTQIACTYALAIPAVAHGKKPEELTEEDRALQKEYAAKAMKALFQATSGPYVDLISLDTDPDLAPLRNLPDYQQWKQGILERSAGK